MPEDDDSVTSDFPAAEKSFTDGDKDKAPSVDLWHAHPTSQPSAPYHVLTTKMERRRPENATIRRWMGLADQVLNTDSRDVPPTKSRKRSSSVNSRRESPLPK